MKNTNTILVVIIVLLAAGFLFYTNSNKEGTTLNVVGEAKVESLADQVSIYVGIETLQKTAEESKNENSEISDNVLTALLKADILKADIETSSYNIYPEYDYDYQNGKQTLKGYKTVNILKVKTKDFDKVGEIVDASIDSGATTIQSINYELSQDRQNELKTEAISKASEDAKQKAQATAEGLNAKLGKVKSVSIQDYNYYPFPLYAAESGVAVKEAIADTVIQPSSLEVTATVNVVFELN